jgi:Ni,Fe-hydrogenase I small subunit
MAITRREFVTRLGTLAAAVGIAQADISKMAEAFAGNSNAIYGGLNAKPRVVWIHGAECTGCSTSLLGFLEDLDGNAIYKSSVDLKTALGLAQVTDALGGTLGTGLPGLTLTGDLRADGDTMVNIADVVIDVIDLQYHETVMGMGGDLAAQWLNDFAKYNPSGLVADKSKPGEQPFVLVVEGALQDAGQGGAWSDTGTGSWCSIGMSDTTGSGKFENDIADIAFKLATKSTCVGIIPIGQCASYGGYPGCKPQITDEVAGFAAGKSQTGATGMYKFLETSGASADVLAKVFNVPGCPTNPWWFCLTVVMFMINLASPGAVDMSTDYGRRLKAVYPITVHSAFCPRYGDYNNGRYALKVGDPGCLQKLGCKGIGTNSLCGIHGWNNQQPQNLNSLAVLNGADATKRGTGKGGHCTRAGAPCMACTEQGYPDSFVPFVKR